MRLETDRLILRFWYDSDAEELISMPKTHRWGLSQGGEAGTGKVWIQIPVDYRQRGCAIDA